MKKRILLTVAIIGCTGFYSAVVFANCFCGGGGNGGAVSALFYDPSGKPVRDIIIRRSDPTPYSGIQIYYNACQGCAFPAVKCRQPYPGEVVPGGVPAGPVAVPRTPEVVPGVTTGMPGVSGVVSTVAAVPEIPVSAVSAVSAVPVSAAAAVLSVPAAIVH